VFAINDVEYNALITKYLKLKILLRNKQGDSIVKFYVASFKLIIKITQLQFSRDNFLFFEIKKWEVQHLK